MAGTEPSTTPRPDLLLTGFSEVATMAGPLGPRTGPAQGELAIIEDGAIACQRGRIVWVGPERKLRRSVRPSHGVRRRSFPGGIALPGFVDAHTHVLFAGSREGEVGRKVRGESYLEIARKGGGLFRTVRETREASPRTLFEQARSRLERMRNWGTTSAEVKSGYCLTLEGELKLLRLVPRLSNATGMNLIPTFLGGHAFPPEARGDHRGYLRTLNDRMIPAVSRENLAMFCDVFCEEGFFSASESEKVLRAGMSRGMLPKIHADEFSVTGGAEVAARLSAVSADHLLETPARTRAALARARVVAVLLPVTPMASLAGSRSPGREMVDAGVAVALGTDLSPNSWVESMPMVLGHAVHSARLTPSEALVAATVNAAYASGMGGTAGELVPGRWADIVVFDLPGAEHLAYRWGTYPPKAVFLGGKDVLRA
ncbi:MAG: imidazolonepropionase [Euryarchaeota archaeon]|nr:imidazolonepropionase [Euryarchaeota archaeon]MDE1836739.1 imidazolonepropionase [Euryarchaeota archaeon]MDE1879757.1 imidazolonepropionase [Euryarchaeota archaeon]MDE2044723.1 imidazolonepropionase [Thermoplasmata archaeon]